MATPNWMLAGHVTCSLLLNPNGLIHGSPWKLTSRSSVDGTDAVKRKSEKTSSCLLLLPLPKVKDIGLRPKPKEADGGTASGSNAIKMSSPFTVAASPSGSPPAGRGMSSARRRLLSPSGAVSGMRPIGPGSGGNLLPTELSIFSRASMGPAGKKETEKPLRTRGSVTPIDGTYTFRSCVLLRTSASEDSVPTADTAAFSDLASHEGAKVNCGVSVMATVHTVSACHLDDDAGRDSTTVAAELKPRRLAFPLPIMAGRVVEKTNETERLVNVGDESCAAKSPRSGRGKLSTSKPNGSQLKPEGHETGGKRDRICEPKSCTGTLGK